MTAVRRFFTRLAGSLFRRRRDTDLAEEIDAHLGLLTDELIARGLTPEAASQAARREFGGVAAVREAAADERGLPGLDSLLQDMRFALRQLRQHPGFAAAAVLILGIGIGTNTGLFSIVDAVMLRPLPYPHPDRLVVIHERQATRGTIPVSAADADVWRSSSASFEQIALLWPDSVNLSEAGEPTQLGVARVSPAALSMLGLRTELGRLLRDDEAVEGRDNVIVLGHAIWRERFNGDRAIVGRRILLNGTPNEVVGVLARDSQPPELNLLYSIRFAQDPPQIWKPLALTASQRPSIGGHNFAAIARLRDGVSLSQAGQELEAVQAHLRHDIPAKGDIGTVVVPLQQQMAGRARAGLQLLLLAVGVLLLIGCGNIANLLLTRTIGRRREFAVRQALGAGRGRLVRQMLVESLTLCGIGAVAGSVIAAITIRAVVALAPVDVPRLSGAHLDGRALLVIGGLTLLTAIIIGAVPAWRVGRLDLGETMKARSEGASVHISSGLRTALVGSQIALSALGLIVAGLLLRSFVRLVDNDKGFNADHVLTIDLNLGGQRYTAEESRAAFSDALLERVQRLPGVVNAATASALPLTGRTGTSAVSIDGSMLPASDRPAADVRSVTSSYFQTLNISLREGRLLTDADRERFVTVISASLAARAWPGQRAIGQRFRFGINPAASVYEVVGIVADTRNQALDQPPTSTTYVPYPQRTAASAALLVRSAQDPALLASALRAQLRAVDAGLPIGAFRTIDDVVRDATADRSFQMRLVVAFALAGVLLATIGVYSLLAYSVAQRNAEFGVRLALGAQPGGLSRLVLRDAVTVVVGGLLVAIPAALALGSSLRAYLFGIAASDLPTLIGVPLLVAGAALLAAYLPSRRASRIDPMTALRSE